MKILIIDNYDSFTFNLVHQVEKLSDRKVTVMLNDQIDFDAAANFDKIILSPGPGLPQESGRLMEFLEVFHHHKQILGVCLGLQAITLHYGGKLLNLPKVFHGFQTDITVDKNAFLYNGLPARIPVGRYHSWVADPEQLPSCLNITAVDDENNIMSFEHKQLPITGVQFHPESILTPQGDSIISNWLKF